jgi:hypothetical protein
LLIAASELCPEKEDFFNNIDLLQMTIQQKIADISNNLHNQLQNMAAIFKFSFD